MYPGTFLLRLLVLCQISGDVISSLYGNYSCYSCSHFGDNIGNNIGNIFGNNIGDNQDCQKYEALKKAVDEQHNNQVLLKKCGPDEKHCMIEAYIKEDKVHSIIRDCTNETVTWKDNGWFSFPQEGRLKRVKNDNITRCTFDKETEGLVCVTLCQGNLCNGPQSAAGVQNQGLHALLISIGLVIYQTVWIKK